MSVEKGLEGHMSGHMVIVTVESVEEKVRGALKSVEPHLCRWRSRSLSGDLASSLVVHHVSSNAIGHDMSGMSLSVTCQETKKHFWFVFKAHDQHRWTPQSTCEKSLKTPNPTHADERLVTSSSTG